MVQREPPAWCSAVLRWTYSRKSADLCHFLSKSSAAKTREKNSLSDFSVIMFLLKSEGSCRSIAVFPAMIIDLRPGTSDQRLMIDLCILAVGAAENFVV